MSGLSRGLYRYAPWQVRSLVWVARTGAPSLAVGAGAGCDAFLAPWNPLENDVISAYSACPVLTNG